jgi:hypothetical protein
MPALCVLLFYLVLGHTHEEIRIVAGLAYLASMNLHRMVPSMCQKGGSFCPPKKCVVPGRWTAKGAMQESIRVGAPL